MRSPMRKYCKALVNLTIALISLLLVLFLLPRVLIFFMPFIIGWLIALPAAPLVRFFEEKIKLKRKAGSAFVIVAVISLVVFVVYLIGAKLVEEIVGLINSLPDMWLHTQKDLEDVGKSLDKIFGKVPQEWKEGVAGVFGQTSAYLGDALSHVGSPTIEAVSNFARSLPAILIATIMCLLSAYFFVAERGQMNDWLHRNTPRFIVSQYEIIRRSISKSVGGYFKAQLKIEVWIYLLLVIGLSILRVEHALLIGVGIALLDFFPFFGTGTVMVPWAVIKILSGNYQMAIWILIIWGVSQLVRQIIQPKIMGDSMGVPPIPTLFLLYIGYKFSGVLGMILAVPIGLLVYAMYEEGAFETTRNSIMILLNGINRFRKLDRNDLEGLKEEADAASQSQNQQESAAKR